MTAQNGPINKGTGTWNDEDCLILEPQVYGTIASKMTRLRRFHLRGKNPLSPGDYTKIQNAISNPADANSLSDLLNALEGIKAGEPKDIRVDDIKIELTKSYATAWRLALVSDTNGKGVTQLYFEISREF